MTARPSLLAASAAAIALGTAGPAVLLAGGSPVWALLAVVGGGAVLVGTLVLDPSRLTGGLVSIGAAASCWDAVRLGSLSLFDLLCVVGLVAVIAGLLLKPGTEFRWPDRALLVGFGGFTLATLLVAVFPVDSFYLMSRYRLGGLSAAGLTDAGMGEMTDLGGLSRLAIGAIVLPVVLGRYALSRPGLTVVGRGFVAGATASAVVAVTDYLGITTIGQELVGYVNAGARSTGLTTQPNHLALTAVMAMPFVWMLYERRLTRCALLAVLLVAITVSGSRAGLIGAAVVVLVCSAWRYRARFLLASVPVAAAAALAAPALLSLTRFGTAGAGDSDLERSRLAQQGLEDFLHSPLFGIGLRVSQDAHVVYLQLLASTGLIGLASFVLIIGAALAAAARMRRQPVALAAGISLIAYLAVAAASNALLTRYLFVPLAILFVGSAIRTIRERSDSGMIGSNRTFRDGPPIGAMSGRCTVGRDSETGIERHPGIRPEPVSGRGRMIGLRPRSGLDDRGLE